MISARSGCNYTLISLDGFSLRENKKHIAVDLGLSSYLIRGNGEVNEDKLFYYSSPNQEETEEFKPLYWLLHLTGSTHVGIIGLGFIMCCVVLCSQLCFRL